MGTFASTSAKSDHNPPNWFAIGAALAALSIFGVWLLVELDARRVGLLLLGAGFGAALLYGAFGFTAGWRSVVTTGDGRNLRAQFLVIILTMIAFVPLINGYGPEGWRLNGAVFPASLSVVIGSFLFGIGMQLGNGCGSGTLFTFGGGSKRMLFTLPAFIAGSVIGAMHGGFWRQFPSLGQVNLADSLTVPGAIAVQASILIAIGAFTLAREKRLGLSFEDKARPAGWWVRGPWPLYVAGLAIVLLNIVTLFMKGSPWSITYGFAIWGGAAIETIGYPIYEQAYLGWAREAGQLQRAVFTSSISIMNIGLIFGAMLAAGIGSTFAKGPSLKLGMILAAMVGGLLMGYGARLSFGCNIGAFYAGIASASLHGWIWFLFAFLGSLVGIRLRPLFGMAK